MGSVKFASRRPMITGLANDRALGGMILILSVVGIVVYGLLLYYWSIIILEITALLAVVVLLGIVAWIGWTMASTPPPEPVSEAPPTPTPSPETKTP